MPKIFFEYLKTVCLIEKLLQASCILDPQATMVYLEFRTINLQLINKYYLLTNWLAYLYERIQNPRPDVMPDRREGITRAAGFGFACIDTQAS